MRWREVLAALGYPLASRLGSLSVRMVVLLSFSRCYRGCAPSGCLHCADRLRQGEGRSRQDKLFGSEVLQGFREVSCSRVKLVSNNMACRSDNSSLSKERATFFLITRRQS